MYVMVDNDNCWSNIRNKQKDWSKRNTKKIKLKQVRTQIGAETLHKNAEKVRFRLVLVSQSLQTLLIIKSLLMKLQTLQEEKRN